MNCKKAFYLCIGIVLGLLCLVCGIVIFVDPYFHYHKPAAQFEYDINNESYQNPGIIRNFEHDSILVGSSMIEALWPSDFDALYNINMIKIPFSGGSIKNHAISLEQEFSHNKNTKMVFYSIDWYALAMGVDEVKMELPEYLYDDNVLNDFSYLLNKEMWSGELIDAVMSRPDKDSDMDTAYDFTNEHVFSKKEVMSRSKFLAYDVENNLKQSEPLLDENALKNLEENIIPFIDEHPDTQFVFFFPPYSISMWQEFMQQGVLDYDLYNMKYVAEELLKHNVEVHFLAGIDEMKNPYLFMDTMHYSDIVARRLPTYLFDKKYMITEDNIDKVFNDFDIMLKEYDFGVYDTTNNPCIDVCSLPEYMDMIEDDRYQVFVCKADCVEDCDSRIGLISSRGYSIDNSDTIIIDGLNYVYNPEKINIVVLNKEHNIVIDSVSVEQDNSLIHY